MSLKLNFTLHDMPEIVLGNVKRLEILGTNPFGTASFKTVMCLSTVHGICKSHFTCNGSNWTAGVTAGTTVWCREKINGKNLVNILLSIMENGLSNVYSFSRFVHFLWFADKLCTMLNLFHFITLVVTPLVYVFFAGASFCCPLGIQSIDAFHWLANLFHLTTLQVTC